MRFWVLWLCFWLSGTASMAAQPNVTSYRQMTAQLNADAARSPFLRIASLGKSARGGRGLWLVRVADPRRDPTQTTRVLILCRQHGDEPASTEAVLHLLHRLAGGLEPDLQRTLSQVTLYVVPMMNPDGAEANTRVNGVGADLNRDWGVFGQPETRAVSSAAVLLRPDFVLDAHNWDGDDEYDADCLEVPREMMSPAGKAAHVMQQETVGALDRLGYSIHPTAWGEDAKPTLAHRWFTHQHIPSALVETHYGSPLDRADYLHRQGLYVALIEHLARRFALAGGTGRAPGPVREAALFPPPALAALTPLRSALGRLPRLFPAAFLWAFGLFGLALWGLGERGRGKGQTPRKETGRAARCAGGRYAHFYSRTILRGSPTARTPESAPASEKRSAGRPGKRRCRY